MFGSNRLIHGSSHSRNHLNCAACLARTFAVWQNGSRRFRNSRTDLVLTAPNSTDISQARAILAQMFSHAFVLFFEIGAHVLLEPVDRIRTASDPVSRDFLTDFVGTGIRNLPEDIFSKGFYSFSRRGFLDADQFVSGLVFVKRDKGSTFIRGYEPKEAMDAQGLTINHQAREFRGFILQQEDGIAAVVLRRNSMTSSLN